MDSPYIVAIFDEVGGKGVAEGVAGAGFGDGGLGDGGFDGALKGFFAEVVAADEAGARIGGEGAGGEDPLPGPFLGGARVLPGEGIGQEDVGLVGIEVLGVEDADLRQMFGQRLFEASGEHGEAVLLAFAVPDGDLVHFEVNIFDAEAQAFHEKQTRPVEKGGHEVGCAVQGVQDRLDFGAGEDDGETFGPSGRGDAGEGRQRNTKGFAVEEQEGVAGDVLGGSGDVLLDGQVGEVVTNGVGAEGGGVSFAVEDDEASDGGKIAVLGAEAEVLEANDGADLFQEGVRVAWVGVARVKVVGAVHGGSFLERYSSVSLCFSGVFGIMFRKAVNGQGSQQTDTSRLFCVAVLAAESGVLYLTFAVKASVGVCYTAGAFFGLAAITAAATYCYRDAAKAAVIACYAALVRYSNKLGCEVQRSCLAETLQ